MRLASWIWTNRKNAEVDKAMWEVEYDDKASSGAGYGDWNGDLIELKRDNPKGVMIGGATELA